MTITKTQKMQAFVNPGDTIFSSFGNVLGIRKICRLKKTRNGLEVDEVLLDTPIPLTTELPPEYELNLGTNGEQSSAKWPLTEVPSWISFEFDWNDDSEDKQAQREAEIAQDRTDLENIIADQSATASEKKLAEILKKIR